MTADAGPGPCHFVIFGATGNLAQVKLLPALYELDAAGRLNDDLMFVALGRRPWDDADWREHLTGAVRAAVGRDVDENVLTRFAARFEYLRGNLNDPGTYDRLFEVLSRPRMGFCENIVFYLAIRPEDFLTVVDQLDRVGLNRSHGRHRIVVEKPFGRDLESARELNRELHRHFDEEQVYRIDHYLGKETVQNLLVFRLANTLIEPLWNRNFVDHVQITVAENIGIESRAGYFDSTGTLRDMVQNHLLQLLAAVAMEPPATMSAHDRRDEKVKVLRSLRPIPGDRVGAVAVRGQYGPGELDGKAVPGYREEDGVPADSVTETYVALKLYIDNWRWRGVPFYLRTGKRLPRKQSLIAIRFRQPPQQLFRTALHERIRSNWIYLSLQPEESMQVELHAKQPGLELETRTVRLNTGFREDGEVALDAYETLLLDVIEGDASLFIRFDEVEESWKVVTPLMEAWADGADDLRMYPAGSWGPDEAKLLFDSPAHVWRKSMRG
jgi:glucose-6-phosphate 1-dehydrogenase